MNKLIDTILSYYRTVLLLSTLVVIGGVVSYITIPKEDTPDINLPLIYVGITHNGISAQDADRLLVKPMIRELNSIDGLKETKSVAAEGYANIILEFESDINIDQTMQDVREKVDRAKADLPEATNEPKVEEINLSLFPVLTINLSGSINEKALFDIADNLKDKIEALAGVLEVTIAGKRDELVEILIDPANLEIYKISLQQVINHLRANNKLITAGKLDTGNGRFAVKLPGLLASINELLDTPIKIVGNKVITYRDIAVVRRGFVDAADLNRVDGESSVSLGIKKRIGANIIDTIGKVRSIIAGEQARWPDNLEVSFIQDQSEVIHNSLNNLFNSVIAATFLVMIVIIMTIGVRSALLIGVSIPVSFLAAILVLSLLGLTMNMVVLFALILSVGMLVDSALVVVEYADRRISEGVKKFQAYAEAAKKMAWPVIGSTLTTLTVFATLLFWPDLVGEFMWYIPITVIIVLTSALIVSLVLLPTLGFVFGKDQVQPGLSRFTVGELSWHGINKKMSGLYLQWLVKAIRYPILTLCIAIAGFILIIFIYNLFGKGVEFFPKIEPERAVVYLRSTGNYALQERDEIVRRVEKEILPIADIKHVSTRVITQATEQNEPEDLIGRIALEFQPWLARRSASAIKTEIREKTQAIPGLIIEIAEERAGPQSAADIMIEIGSQSHQKALAATVKIVDLISEDTAIYPDITDLRDSRPAKGIEWEIKVDREEAGRYGLDLVTTGNMLQMITRGYKIGEYIPEDSKEEIDIKLRFPPANRTLDQIDKLKTVVNGKLIPISNYITKEARPSYGQLVRVNGQFIYDIQMNIKPGVNLGEKLAQLEQLLRKAMPEDVSFRFRGDKEDQDRAGMFLLKAFGTAIFLMIVILVTQFNSFYQAVLTLTAVVFSTMGVLMGLMLKGEAFGIVMSGVGVIALAGIVVNNNIILIDTFNQLRKSGINLYEAILRTGLTRLRPVVLTSVTTVTGLLPMVFQLSIDFVNGTITYGEPSTQWWVQLATAIAGGLIFATLVTLFLTPALLYLVNRKDQPQGIQSD